MSFPTQLNPNHKFQFLYRFIATWVKICRVVNEKCPSQTWSRLRNNIFLHACTRKVQNCNSHTASHEMDVEWRDKRRQRRSHKEWKHVLIFHVRFQEVLKEFSLTVWEKRRREWRNIRKFLLLLPLTLDCLYFFTFRISTGSRSYLWM